MGRGLRAYLPYQGTDPFDRDVGRGGMKQRLSGYHRPIILRDPCRGAYVRGSGRRARLVRSRRAGACISADFRAATSAPLCPD
jgi:hypothetical protein